MPDFDSNVAQTRRRSYKHKYPYRSFIGLLLLALGLVLSVVVLGMTQDLRNRAQEATYNSLGGNASPGSRVLVRISRSADQNSNGTSGTTTSTGQSATANGTTSQTTSQTNNTTASTAETTDQTALNDSGTNYESSYMAVSSGNDCSQIPDASQRAQCEENERSREYDSDGCLNDSRGDNCRERKARERQQQEEEEERQREREQNQDDNTNCADKPTYEEQMRCLGDRVDRDPPENDDNNTPQNPQQPPANDDDVDNDNDDSQDYVDRGDGGRLNNGDDDDDDDDDDNDNNNRNQAPQLACTGAATVTRLSGGEGVAGGHSVGSMLRISCSGASVYDYVVKNAAGQTLATSRGAVMDYNAQTIGLLTVECTPVQ